MASDSGCSCYGRYKAKRNAHLVSKNIDHQLKAERHLRYREKFMLVIGFPRSESACFINTIQVLYKEDTHLKEDLTELKRRVHRATIQGMVSLLQCMRSLGVDFEDAEAGASAEKVLKIDVEQLQVISKEQMRLLSLLWNDSAVRRCFILNRHKLDVFSSAGYFFNSLERISQEDYMPSDIDLINLPQSLLLSPLVEFRLNVEHQQVWFVCISNLQSQHRHFHCFEHADAVLLLASVASYDIVDGASADRELDDIVQQVKSVSHSPWFGNADIHIVLTGKDILTDKVHHSKNSDFLPNGSRPDVDIIKRIRKRFADACRRDEPYNVHVHCIDSTAKADIKAVMVSLQDQLLICKCCKLLMSEADGTGND